MGRRDYRHREPKKSKKDAKKVPPATIIIQPPIEVEVIKKGKQKREEVEEE
jgi:hypothetical protein